MNVLVVEDDVRVADFLERGLKAEGYVITLARNGSNGNKGLELARAGDYALIILDWMLPGLNGIKITQALRAGRVTTPICCVPCDHVDCDGRVDRPGAGFARGSR